jgi:tetratricopeptide (TPR) repeat protein
MAFGHDGSKRGLGSPLARPWLWVALGAVFLVGDVVIARMAIHWYFARRSAQITAAHARAALERKQRAQPAAHVALAPLPDKLPLIERAGKDAYGYPLSYVDRVALRSLLSRGKYEVLSKYLEQFEALAEADFHNEYQIDDAVDAFETPEPSLSAGLDAWIAATPNSFAPWVARGAHRLALGLAQRGEEFANETDSDNFKGMEAAFALAFGDLEHALRSNPRLMPARRIQIRIAFVGSRHAAELHAMCRRAFEICPACFLPRATQQMALEPRWGGSYERMNRAAKAADPRLNPRFVQLLGYELVDRASVSASEKDDKDALAFAQRAVALGDNSDFLLRLSRTLANAGDSAGSLKAISRALELRPQRTDLLLFRAYVYTRADLRNYEAAYRDLLLALRVDPTSPNGSSTLRTVAQGLSVMAGEAQQRGDLSGAIRLLDESMDLFPNNATEHRRNALLTSGFHGTADELSTLERAANAAPHDFLAHQRLDYALSQSAQWERIIVMWSAFILDNPAEGRAYYERSGTYSHVAKFEAARADTVRACELGVSVACARAAQLR